MSTTEKPCLTTPHKEPASEWASSTLSALDPAIDTPHPPQPQSAPETPGVSMPGSYPIPKEGLVPPDVQGVASDALKSAKEYAQIAAQGAQTAVQSAGDKVGGYLPQSVASYLSSEPVGTQDEAHTNTFPSQVAANQATSDVTKTSPILTTTNNNPLHRHSEPKLERHTGYIPGTLQDDTSLAKLPEERRVESLPSHDDETGGRLGKSDGVGALPGPSNESSVALLPDERKGAQEGISPGASIDASVRTLRGSGHGPTPPGQSHLVAQTTGRDHAFSRDEEKVFGADAKKDFDVPEAVDTKDIDEISVPAQHTHAVGAGSGGLAGAGGAPSEIADVTKKSGFIHKVKGEMKILSGKMSHNETKIEEGRKMMGKN